MTHPSHQGRLYWYKGVLFCVRCGHTTQMPGGRCRGLGRACEVKSEKDRNHLLRRMRVHDLPPRHLRSWPMPDNIPRRYWGVTFTREAWIGETTGPVLAPEPPPQVDSEDEGSRFERQHFQLNRVYQSGGGQASSSQAPPPTVNPQEPPRGQPPTTRNLASRDEEDDPFGFQTD